MFDLLVKEVVKPSGCSPLAVETDLNVEQPGTSFLDLLVLRAGWPGLLSPADTSASAVRPLGEMAFQN